MKLRKEILTLGGKAVPVLVDVMKNGRYPDKNRWVATFLLGQIMGEKSAPFIAKFSKHPNWVLRLASLKTLLALKQREHGQIYANKLKDASLLVRVQALENIRKLKLAQYAPNVWAMLYDKGNYSQGNNGQKRTNIIKTVIESVGDLRFQKALDPLLTMIQKKKYHDIFDEMDYSLTKISGKESPKGTKEVKKIFWKKYAMSLKTI